MVRGLSSFKKSSAMALGSNTPGNSNQHENSSTLNFSTMSKDGSLTPVGLGRKKNLDIAKIQRMSSKASNASSMIESQFESDEYHSNHGYDHNDSNTHQNHRLEDNNTQMIDDEHEATYGSTLKIPLSKYKMLNH